MKLFFITGLIFFIACVIGYFFLMRKYKKEKKKIKWKKDNELTKEVEFYRDDKPINIIKNR